MKGNTLYWKYNVVFCFIYIYIYSPGQTDRQLITRKKELEPWQSLGLITCSGVWRCWRSRLCASDGTPDWRGDSPEPPCSMTSAMQWTFKSVESQRYGNGYIHHHWAFQVKGTIAPWKRTYSSSLSVRQRNHSAMKTDIVTVIECSSKEPPRYVNGHSHRHWVFVKGTTAL